MIATCNGVLLANQIRKADCFRSRFLGLMGRKSLAEEEGLLLLKCPAIHCFFMRFPIDVIYLSQEMKVVGLETVRPWRVGHYFKDAAHVLELPAGSCELKVAIGGHMVFNES